MGYNSRSLWHQIHASYLHKKTSSHRFGGQIHRTPNIKVGINRKHWWKISWHDLPISPSSLGSICRWGIESEGSGIGLVLISPENVIIEKSLRFDFSATNNEAEYEVLLIGMAMVQRMGGKSVKVFLDSRLVVSQVKGEFKAKDERMQGYLSQVKCLRSKFDSFDLLHIPEMVMHMLTL